LVKDILVKEEEEDLANLPDHPEQLGNLQSHKGLGRDVILRFLKSVPGIKDPVVKDQLANLKKSGDYARIDPPHLTITLYKKG
jgi:hypothetical protein